MRAQRSATEVRVRGCHTDAFQYHVCTPTCMQGVRHRPIVGPDLLTGPMFENTMVSRMIFSLFPWVRVTYTGDEALFFSLFLLSPLLRVSRNTLLLPLAACLCAYFFFSSLPLPRLLFPVIRYTFYTYGRRRGSSSYGESLIGKPGSREVLVADVPRRQ